MLQPCGVAKLYSAIFSIPLAQSYDIVGLERCPRCDKPSTKPESYPFCNEKCREALARRAEQVQLVCDNPVCNKKFMRKVSEIISNARIRGRKGFGTRGMFCSRQCSGRVWGLAKGFGAHPENNTGARTRAAQTHCKRGHPFDDANTRQMSGGGRQCKTCVNMRHRATYKPHPRYSKYDRAAIWAKHLETGYGSWKLGRLLGIPESTVGGILTRYRAALTPAP